jgi:hypothetical protein
MESIIEVSEKVLQFLLTYQKEQQDDGKLFYFTLRRSNQQKRLESRYWFYGTDTYLAVSFWAGMDWINKTPNIFIRVTDEGKTFLWITAKDSIKKAAALQRLLVSSLGLEPAGTDRWQRELSGQGYMQALSDFLVKEKISIDKVVAENHADLQGDDPSNGIGFINGVQFQKWLDKVNEYRHAKAFKTMPIFSGPLNNSSSPRSNQSSLTFCAASWGSTRM